MANILVSDNTITCVPNPIFWPVGIMVGQTGSDALNDVTGLTISGNTISGGCYGVLCDGSTTTKIDGNTISDCQGDAIYVQGNTAGTLDISSNKLSNCGQEPFNSNYNNYFNHTAAIMVAGSVASRLTIENNSYGSASQANNLSFFILCDVVNAQVSGNTNPTWLPTYLPP